MTEHPTSDQYAVGELAIYCRPGSRFHGMDVLIESELRGCWARDEKDGGHVGFMGHSISFPGYPCPIQQVAPPSCLRKRRSPSDVRTIVQWMDCPWQPEVLRV